MNVQRKERNTKSLEQKVKVQMGEIVNTSLPYHSFRIDRSNYNDL